MTRLHRQIIGEIWEKLPTRPILPYLVPSQHVPAQAFLLERQALRLQILQHSCKMQPVNIPFMQTN